MEREGREKREGRRGVEMRKGRRGIIMALFLIINILMISCRNGGPESKEQSKELREGQAARADGTVIDLAKVSKNINEAIKFVTSVEEIETLIKSVGELAKAIGKKIHSDGSLTTNTDQNGSLLAGVHSVIKAVDTKLTSLEGKAGGISEDLKTKTTAVKTKSSEFLAKLKSKSSALGIATASDENAKKAIVIGNSAGVDHGATELDTLNSTVDALLRASKEMLDGVVKQLVAPAKDMPITDKL